MNSFMSGGGAFLLIGAVIVLVIVAAVISSINARKRREALAAWAAKHGLQFQPGRDHGFQHRYSALSALNAGEGGRYAYNIITGNFRGRGLCAFDYHYETYSTDKDGRRKTSHHSFSALILDSGLPLRPLQIRPEGIFDRIAAAFGYDDIDFESAEFSRRYKVSSPDRRWAFDILHTRAIEFLLGLAPFTMQMDERRTLWRTSGTWTVEEVEAWSAHASAFLDQIPDYVKQQQTGH